ncbi:unnamed protein product [Sphenostylis stenocarpa]|uniref:Uncharacterized protein n=1 Tax=Sphenostylis stenocarpa TaxID=92480 RepID=A0AA86VMC5_9FABA|nr:unnamed protein product [Sphenostylis stenocarpa]
MDSSQQIHFITDLPQMTDCRCWFLDDGLTDSCFDDTAKERWNYNKRKKSSHKKNSRNYHSSSMYKGENGSRSLIE